MNFVEQIFAIEPMSIIFKEINSVIMANIGKINFAK